MRRSHRAAINGRYADERLAVRRARVAPLVSDLEPWMQAQCAKLSPLKPSGYRCLTPRLADTLLVHA